MRLTLAVPFCLGAILAAPPPPIDIAAFVKAAREHQTVIEKTLENYTYTEHIKKIELDSHGKPKKIETEIREAFYVKGHRLSKLTDKDGQPLEGAAKEKENQRIEKQIRTLEEGKSLNRRGEEIKITDLLRSSRLLNPRVELHDGRELVVTDFAPNPDFKPKNFTDVVLKSVRGYFWIDRADLQVARASFQTTQPVKVGGGLLFRLTPGSWVTIEQKRINGEVYLPVRSEMNFQGRALLAMSLSQHITIDYGGYRKYHVDADAAATDGRVTR